MSAARGNETAVRRPWLRALGADDPPASFAWGERRFAREGVYKHDFFAATARYVDQHGERVILKLGRRAPFFGIPLGWVGRFVTWNEARALYRLQGFGFVPRLVGRPDPRALVRAYVNGTTLEPQAALRDDFFPELERALDALHADGWAYVDLEKPENVIAGDDGKPYLCDFQISWCWPKRFGGSLWPFTWWLRVLQRADRYHLLKLRRRVAPDAMSPEELARSRRKPWPVRVHSTLVRPLQRLRRRLLERLEPSAAANRAQQSRAERRERGRLAEDFADRPA